MRSVLAKFLRDEFRLRLGQRWPEFVPVREPLIPSGFRLFLAQPHGIRRYILLSFASHGREAFDVELCCTTGVSFPDGQVCMYPPPAKMPPGGVCVVALGHLGAKRSSLVGWDVESGSDISTHELIADPEKYSQILGTKRPIEEAKILLAECLNEVFVLLEKNGIPYLESIERSAV
jgi:hypothetical protein